MGDRRGAVSICSRHAHPGHPRQSMVRRRSPEAPSYSKVIWCSTNGQFHIRNAVEKQKKEHRSCQSIRSLDEEARHKKSPSTSSLVVLGLNWW